MPNSKGPQNLPSASLVSDQVPAPSTSDYGTLNEHSMLYEHPYFDEPPHREDCPCSKCCGMRYDQRRESFYDELRLAGMREEDCQLEDNRTLAGSASARPCRQRRRDPHLDVIAMVEVGAVESPTAAPCLSRMESVVANPIPAPKNAPVNWRRPHQGRPSRAMLRNAEE